MTFQSLSGQRTSEIVGRQHELACLEQALREQGVNDYFYIWGEGGCGKTRLLEALNALVAAAGPGYHATGIIDLYHTDLHSTSDIERTIAHQLDQDHRHFVNYWMQRGIYEVLRERGGDAEEIERRRIALAGMFVEEFNRLARASKKLVICIDTVELLQFESSAVEEMAGPEAMEVRIKPWLLDKLCQLQNVLVVFAGRPTRRIRGGATELRRPLARDMRKAFGPRFHEIEIKPFDLDGTATFIEILTKDLGERLIDAQMVPIVHLLTEGKPVFIHLVVDLLYRLASAPTEILALFETYRDLLAAPAEDPRITEARRVVQRNILRGIMDAPRMELGQYLQRIALMPKGFDAEILHATIGLSEAETGQLLETLDPLSFIKRHRAPASHEHVYEQRLLMHDEMYALLRDPGLISHFELIERTVARDLIDRYYAPRIAALQGEIDNEREPYKRVRLRERLQKLQVEQLYYRLVQDPAAGYEEYRRLTAEGNMHRQVGFCMRLLDEFLRYHNDPEHDRALDAVGLTPERVTAEGALMWVERFYWWGQYDQALALAAKIEHAPDRIHITGAMAAGILGNIVALRTRRVAMQSGYEPLAVGQAKRALKRLPTLEACGPVEVLARARLTVTIGYHLLQAGMLSRSSSYHEESLAAFRSLGSHRGEFAMSLNNLAYIYALMGRFSDARILAHEARDINTALGIDYALGLTLGTLSVIAYLRGSYDHAKSYAQEALELFKELGHRFGLYTARITLARALRREAEHEIRQGGARLAEAQNLLTEALLIMNILTDPAHTPGQSEEQTLQARAERGRIYRAWARLDEARDYDAQAQGNFVKAAADLQAALQGRQISALEEAATRLDLAEVLLARARADEAEKQLVQIENELVGAKYLITLGGKKPPHPPVDRFLVILGSIRLLRGRMAIDARALDRAAEHYLLASVYFQRFSAEAREIEICRDDLFAQQRALTPGELTVLTGHLQRLWDTCLLCKGKNPFELIIKLI